MKTVNIYIRANQVKNLDNEVDKIVGCLLLDYMGKHKYIFYDDLNESTIQKALLKLAKEGIMMLKEPCNVLVHSVTSVSWHSKVNRVEKVELLNLVNSKKHEFEFVLCHENDEGENMEIFTKFKNIMRKYKREWKNNLIRNFH